MVELTRCAARAGHVAIAERIRHLPDNNLIRYMSLFMAPREREAARNIMLYPGEAVIADAIRKRGEQLPGRLVASPHRLIRAPMPQDLVRNPPMRGIKRVEGCAVERGSVKTLAMTFGQYSPSHQLMKRFAHRDIAHSELVRDVAGENPLPRIEATRFDPLHDRPDYPGAGAGTLDRHAVRRVVTIIALFSSIWPGCREPTYYRFVIGTSERGAGRRGAACTRHVAVYPQ